MTIICKQFPASKEMKSVPYRSLSLTATLVLGSCVLPLPVANSPEVRAACAAQAYLQSNGYLAPLKTFEPSAIDLALWDRLKYEVKGEMDWQRLLKDRQGRFFGKLYGAGRRDDGHLVFYKIENNFSCVAVSADFTDSDLRESNCRLRTPITRLNERDAKCG
jgi:hypothetical protein